ncbi:MAG: sigma-54 dependent transcriptional regulator [bacterium]|jgi:two-component system response regulator HydG|nr:sigma-54-dependent Fis family transcriptional regulator [Bacteroidales bacterium]MBR6227823.1 sigma-54-dependent Fis family transcriptional regulator [Bacteroidales bacterium]MDO5316005.1 sigma-54 dependent transcriptional regulator [bacterium]
MKCRILVVEDDASFGMMIQTWLKKNGYEAVLASRYEQAKIEISNGGFDLILTDLRLPDGDGIILMTHVREKLKSKVPFIVMTGYAEVQTAVSAMKLGAFDYLKKPINPSVLEEKIAAALASTEEENTGDFLPSNKQWVRGTSPTMQRLYKHVELVAPTKFSVLILGESGTGKEYIARMIHDMSQNKEGPFIPVDCGSLSKELAPSELFGHLKGSFTSAIADKKGVFEQAKGGTVFLDEVGNLPYEVQMQLLRALQEQKVRPVGSATDIHVDVRILAATNENLEQAIEEGRFRQDLFHRINEFAIEVPPLRDRLEDFDELTAFFIRQANEELGKNVKGISDDALRRMKEQRWNGNLRELRNVVRRCVLFAESENIELDDLPVFSPPNKKTLITTVEDDWALRPEHEKEQIEAALQKARGNKTVAAKLLQIDRKTLYNKMHLYGIEL